MTLKPRTGVPSAQPAWLVPTTHVPGRRGRRSRYQARRRRRAAVTAAVVMLLCLLALAPWAAARLGLTRRQGLFLMHSAAGIVALHAAAGGVGSLLPAATRGRELLRRASAVALAAGAWFAVLLGTWAGYPGYLTSPQSSGSMEAAPRAWLLARTDLAVWDLAMSWKVQVGWISPFLLTSVAVVVLRQGASLTRDPVVRCLIRVLLAVGVGAAAVAALIGAAVNVVAPNDYLR